MLIPPAWNGKPMAGLFRDNPDCLPVALTRTGRALLPHSETILQTRDVLNVSATFEGIQEMHSRLDAGTEG